MKELTGCCKLCPTKDNCPSRMGYQKKEEEIEKRYLEKIRSIVRDEPLDVVERTAKVLNGMNRNQLRHVLEKVRDSQFKMICWNAHSLLYKKAGLSN